MNIQQAFKAMDACFLANLTPHFIGLHGIGKSAMVYQYADVRGYEVVEVRVGQMADAGDLVGIQEFVKCELTGQPYSTRHVLPDWVMKLVDAIKLGKKFILFFDELNRGHKDLLQAIFEIVYDLSLKGVKFAKGNVHVVAASNPPSKDYAVLDFNDSAFQDRFVHIKLEPTAEEFIQYGRTLGNIETSVLDFLIEYPAMLENKNLESFNLDFVKPSRRSWDRVNKLIKAGVDKEIELELFMGIVGKEPALSFTKFRDTYFKSIKAETVLNNYSKVKKDIQSAIAKGRVDMIGTLNEELEQLLKGMDKLTMNQADNLAELAEDLPAEHAFALAINAKNNQQCTLKIEDLDDSKMIQELDGKPVNFKELGLFAHKRFVDRVNYVKVKRDEIRAQMAETTKTTDVPF